MRNNWVSPRLEDKQGILNVQVGNLSKYVNTASRIDNDSSFHMLDILLFTLFVSVQNKTHVLTRVPVSLRTEDMALATWKTFSSEMFCVMNLY